MSDPTKLQMLLAELNKTGSSDFNGVYKQVPFRVQLHLYVRLTALVTLMESSRNKVLNDLLDIALDEVSSKLSPELLEVLGQLESKAYAEAIDTNPLALRAGYSSGDMQDD